MISGTTEHSELDGIDIVWVPSLVEVMIDDQERTVVRLSIERCSADSEAPPSGVPAAEAETGHEFRSWQ